MAFVASLQDVTRAVEAAAEALKHVATADTADVATLNAKTSDFVECLKVRYYRSYMLTFASIEYANGP